MNVDEIISRLEYHHEKFPRAAIAKAIEEKDLIVPRLLQVLENVATNIHEIDEDEGYMLHIYAMYLLAQFRETDAYLPIVKIFSIPGDVANRVAGDVVTTDLGRILASTFNGDLDPIKRLIEDQSVNEYVRSAGLKALCALWGCGAISRQEIIDYYKYILSEALVGEDSSIWTTSITSILGISPNELEEEINVAFEEGLIDEFFVNRDDFVSSLGYSNDEALMRFRRRDDLGLIEDVISEMKDWGCFRQRVPAKRSPANSAYRLGNKKVGRNASCPCGSGRKYKKCCYASA